MGLATAVEGGAASLAAARVELATRDPCVQLSPFSRHRAARDGMANRFLCSRGAPASVLGRARGCHRAGTRPSTVSDRATKCRELGSCPMSTDVILSGHSQRYGRRRVGPRFLSLRVGIVGDTITLSAASLKGRARDDAKAMSQRLIDGHTPSMRRCVWTRAGPTRAGTACPPRSWAIVDHPAPFAVRACVGWAQPLAAEDIDPAALAAVSLDWERSRSTALRLPHPERASKRRRRSPSLRTGHGRRAFEEASPRRLKRL